MILAAAAAAAAGGEEAEYEGMEGKGSDATLPVEAQEVAVGRCFLERVFPSLIVYLHRAEQAAEGKPA